MKENIIQAKTYQFALRIIKLYQFLIRSKREYVLAKQILRSGTSVGANVEEAIGARSKNDFIFKITIAYKEARETLYWLKLLRDSEYLTQEQACSLISDNNEILNILGKIQMTVKSKYNS